MNSRSFHFALGVLAFAPIAAAQDSDESILSTPTRPIALPTHHLPPAPASSAPGRIQPLFTNIATSATSDVPGAPPGTKFTSGSGTTNFDKPWVSPNGQHWAIRADTPLTGTEDSVLMVDGTLFMREGTWTPFNPGTNWGTTDIRVGIGDNGDVALFTNTTEAANDDYILLYTAAGGTWSIIAQEASSIPALPGVTYDDDLDSISLLSNGTVAFHANGIDGAGITSALNDEIFLVAGVLNAQSNVTIPTGQAGGATNTWQNLTFENMYVSPDGLHVLIDGDTDNATTTADDVTTYDGVVVIQEGQVLPGTAFTSPVVSLGPDELAMDSAGRWYARGNNVDGQDWVVRNGVVLVKTDDLLATSGERVLMTVTLDGAQVVPPSGSTAAGSGTLLVDTSNNTLTYDIAINGLLTAETGATLNGPAGVGGVGGVLYSLPLGNTKQGVILYSEAEENVILGGLTYIEVTTSGLPAGEIRGQVLVGQESYDDADFADGFFAMCGNAQGDWVVGSLTNAPSLVNGVLV